MDTKSGEWRPDPGWDPKLPSSNLDNMDVLGQEGESFMKDGTIRINTHADYKEALLPPHGMTGEMEASESNLLLLPNGEMMCVWVSRLKPPKQPKGACEPVLGFTPQA